MSEQYPTQQEDREALDEIFAQDPDLYNYIVHAEYELPVENVTSDGPLFQVAGILEVDEPEWINKIDEYIAETYLG